VHRNLEQWDIRRQRKRLMDKHNFIPAALVPYLGSPTSVLYVDVWAVNFFDQQVYERRDLSVMLMLQLAYIAHTKLAMDAKIRLFGSADNADAVPRVAKELEALIAEQRLDRMTEVHVLPMAIKGDSIEDMLHASANIAQAASQHASPSGRPHSTAVTLLSFPPQRLLAGQEGHFLRLMEALSRNLGPVLFVHAEGSVLTDSI